MSPIISPSLATTIALFITALAPNVARAQTPPAADAAGSPPAPLPGASVPTIAPAPVPIPPAAAPAPMPPPFAPTPPPPPPAAPAWLPPAPFRAPSVAPPDTDLSSSGLPFYQRGRIGFDAAGYLADNGNDDGAGVELVASLPLTERTFVDAVFPVSLSHSAGNPSVGAHHLFRVAKSAFVLVGGAVGAPLMKEPDDAGKKEVSLDAGGSQIIERDLAVTGKRSIANGFWNLHYYYHDTMPFTLRLGAELQRGLFQVRVQAEPSLLVRLQGLDDEVTFQHAIEGQVGHRVAGGVRLQGVLLGDGDNRYQAAVEPFIAFEHAAAMLRLGVLLPIDKPLAPAFENAWGFRFSTGIRLD